MDQSNRDPFADIDSNLDGRAPAVGHTEAADQLDHSAQYSERTLRASTQQRIEVKCEKCRGRGRFISYSGRDCGPCFACEGKGKILRAPGYVEGKARREAAKAAQKAEASKALVEALSAALEAHPAEVRALVEYRAQSRYRSEFMDSLGKQLFERGSLSGSQWAAIARGIERQQERVAERATAPKTAFPRIEKLVREGNLTLHLDICKVTAFKSGVVGVVAPVFGGGTYGIIEQGGGFRRHGACTDEIFAVLQRVEAEGIEAVKAIGRTSGRCCVCSRTLTDPVSIEAGIGPICAEKIGSFSCERA